MSMGVHPVRSPLPAMRRERERESKGWQSQRCPCTLSSSKPQPRILGPYIGES